MSYENEPINHDAKADVVIRLVREVRDNYCYPGIGEAIAKAIESTAYEGAATLGDLADLLTTQLRSVNNDRHFIVQVTTTKQEEPKPKSADIVEQGDVIPDATVQRFAISNFGVPKVEVLEGRIGYFNWTAIAPLPLAKDVLISTLNLLSDTEALIVDLRECRGGSGETADLFYAFLFDQETHVNDFYWRPDNATHRRIVGQKDLFPELKRSYTGKPVYVLTSPATFSCAEAIAYTLKTFEKATIVGTAKTGGGAHPGQFFYLHPYLRVFISTGCNINTKTGTDWEGDGVAPDVQVASSEEGLAVAHAHALKQVLARRRDEWSKKDYMAPYIQTLEAKLNALEGVNGEDMDVAP
ncbi:Aste57867_10623 [Aphanomyces stellatus]|uniref:Aste57867_10623 protein n=1 Tax=Aphanomyces stellatus TaxID=120398 RepID=A0A485KRD1_9STRA|nr:hypothetical protein As57867_010583 [Aphanomyces stellatus]VFT87495.1 Aste57867_10623 [Aphanomyces stellatus]